MTEIIIMGVFAAILLVCLAADVSILAALLMGYMLFFGYSLYKRHGVRETIKFSLDGIKTIKNILITFALIGIITGVWRASGTIAFIVCEAVKFCSPKVMVLASFLLCSLVSLLTGTSFGTAATMGVICMTVSDSMGVPSILSGGAVLSGCLFGDRCSPMSTSALLISELTGTDIYTNIKNMVKTALVPTIAAIIIYLVLGLFAGGGASAGSAVAALEAYFNMNPVMLLPAISIILMSLFKTEVKLKMAVSIVLASFAAVFVQKIGVKELFHVMIFGFTPSEAAAAKLISGGGVISMGRVIGIVCLSSCFSGIFRGTGFLDEIKQYIQKLSCKTNVYTVILIVSLLTGLVACNQTLCIMLTYQLCEELEKDRDTMAVHLENTAVLTAPLVPWSIAGTVPLDSAGAPHMSIITGFYLYLVPVWRMIVEARKKKALQAK